MEAIFAGPLPKEIPNFIILICLIYFTGDSFSWLLFASTSLHYCSILNACMYKMYQCMNV